PDSLDRTLHHLVAEHDLDLHLGEEIDDVFSAAIELGMALLTAETLGLRYRDSLEADFLERFLHLVKLARFDDRFDLLHRLPVSENSRNPAGERPAGSTEQVCPIKKQIADSMPAVQAV